MREQLAPVIVCICVYDASTCGQASLILEVKGAGMLLLVFVLQPKGEREHFHH